MHVVPGGTEIALKYMTAFTSLHGAPVVEEGVESQQISNECRDAALTFLRGVTSGWDKIDLALWLTGDYARATRHVPRGERVMSLGDREVDPASLNDLLDKARGQLVACFEQAALDGNLACAEDCLTRGIVRKVTAPDGGVLYVPVDSPRMRLRDRLRSLLAADYLNEPGDYLSVYVCHRCENVVFDEKGETPGLLHGSPPSVRRHQAQRVS